MAALNRWASAAHKTRTPSGHYIDDCVTVASTRVARAFTAVRPVHAREASSLILPNCIRGLTIPRTLTLREVAAI